MKTAILIDGANTHGAAKSLNLFINYAAVLNYFKGNVPPTANYYTALVTESDGTNNLRELIDWLSYNGYYVVTKESKMFVDEITGQNRVKGNMDIEIAVHAMQLSDFVERIILFSGDGDFTSLILALRTKGVHTTVVSTSSFCADELRRSCDMYIDLRDIRPHIERVFDETQGRRQHMGGRRGST